MAYRKKFTKYPRERREDYMDNTMYMDHSKGPNNEGEIKDRIGIKARSNLPKSTYAIKADPYEASLPNANPYDLIAPFNKTVGGNYSGHDNLDGGNVQQYANSYNSKTLNAFDFARLALAVNYRYIPAKLASTNTPIVHEIEGEDTICCKYVEGGVTKYRPYNPYYVGSGLIDMQRQSIAEATSILQATTFTQMAINNYVVHTDMAMGNAAMEIEEDPDDATKKYPIVFELADVLYLSSRFYQIFWQEAISVISWINSFRLKQGTMIRSSWNRETPTLNSLFGLFNKKAFLSLLDSICLSFEGEYIDTEWVTQLNLLTMMPSRRTNSIHDPVLEVQARHQKPSFFELYYTNEDGSLNSCVFADTELAVPYEGETITFWDACNELKTMFSAENVMLWARNATVRSAMQQNAYYNRVVKLLDVIQECCTKMKVKFNDIREVFDVISRTGLNTWVKGFRPSITKSTDAALFDNLIVVDIYRTIFSGATKITLDSDTKRWRSFTLWDMYDGVPSYDAKSGGCFLTFSGKTIDAATDTDNVRRWVPIAFYVDTTDVTIDGVAPSLKIVTRSGSERNVSPVGLQMSTDQAFARLVPLTSQDGLYLRVPTLQLDVDETISTSESSCLISALCNIFGYCSINSKYYIDPDLLYAYEIEISDVTNDAIKFARVTSPFRGAAPEGDEIGFSTFGQN